MFNLLIALISGVLIGWNFHAFYLQLTPPNILKSDINISQISNEDKNLKIEEVKSEPINQKILNSKKAIPSDPFFEYLTQNQFSDAMALYLDAPNKKLTSYRVTLLDYFKTKANKSPNEGITNMLEFIELEPKHKEVSLVLINTYENLNQYQKAIEQIIKLLETASASEIETVQSKLVKTSQSYLDELNNSQNFENLVSFLQERIELGIKTPFYTYALAEYYVKSQQYDRATTLLKEIEYDYDYGEKAKDLLNLINQKTTQNKEYNHEISLQRVGEHFTVEVNIDSSPLTLLLDTGATLTMVNEAKLSSLHIVNEHIVLNTAGGEINAQLQEANSFSVGDIELENFQIVSSSFEQEKADGLLGMNFFKKFKFKIDQEQSILYLSEKEVPKVNL